MLQFIDLNTGYSFDALWLENQQNGYTFWFPNEQSIRLTYTMPVCIYTDISTSLELNIPTNDIFSFITHNTESKINCDGFYFKEPIYLYTINTEPEKLGDKYVHKFYVACKSDIAGEFTEFININNLGSIKIGADFYGEYESVYINLSNFGVEIPEAVQKTIYNSNVHEDYKDDILLNRKFKELLSNYWDLIANKGSYKSLLNTLSWFEWGDILRIREIWKRTNANKTFYDDRELCSLLENKYNDSLGNFIKTTYLSLYTNLYKDTDQYNSEGNPVLEQLSLKWSKEDLALKLSLLAQFFTTFFMPIHTSLLHACVEDKVYTNTIKSCNGYNICRNDNFGDWTDIKCNITENTVFKIGQVHTQVSENTIFKTDYNQTNVTVGVDNIKSVSKLKEDSLKNFASQYYVGPGVIVPIEFTIENQRVRDFIKYTSLDFIPDGYKDIQKFVFYDKFYTRNGKITIKFNLLVKEARDYALNFMFITGSSKTFTKQVILHVEDADNLTIKLYKVQAKDDTNGLTYDDFNDLTYNNYFFKIQSPKENSYYSQYLPYMLPEYYNNYKGIKLNRTVIIDMLNSNGKAPNKAIGEGYTETELTILRGLMNKEFLEFQRYNENGDLAYTIWVSKKFYADIPKFLIDDKYNIIRSSLGFYPQFHILKSLEGNNINDYTINQYEALCCAAEIQTSNKNKPIPFRYGHLIEDFEWSFINVSTNEIFNHTSSVRQPFIADKNKLLPDGYYDVIFKYKLVDSSEKTLILNSAFRKKSI